MYSRTSMLDSCCGIQPCQEAGHDVPTSASVVEFLQGSRYASISWLSRLGSCLDNHRRLASSCSIGMGHLQPLQACSSWTECSIAKCSLDAERAQQHK
mmetsp:Transcript_52721/g.108958  ORF Transcript_52721/g.108958 Transcript_52721/m.108958 type:complete len:98 (+) Transcript_52721:1982-2275(+)